MVQGENITTPSRNCKWSSETIRFPDLFTAHYHFPHISTPLCCFSTRNKKTLLAPEALRIFLDCDVVQIAIYRSSLVYMES